VPGKCSNSNKQHKLNKQVTTSPQFGGKEQGISMSELPIFYMQVSVCVFVRVCARARARACVCVCTLFHSWYHSHIWISYCFSSPILYFRCTF